MTHKEKADLFYNKFEDKIMAMDYDQIAYEIIESIEKEYGVKFSTRDKELINEDFVEDYGMNINTGDYNDK